ARSRRAHGAPSGRPVREEVTGGRCGPRRPSPEDVEHLPPDAVGVRLLLDQPQLRRVLVAPAERPLARAEQHREDQQVVAVHQAGVGERMAELGAAVHRDRTTLGLLERGDVVEGTQHRSRPPRVALGEGGGDDVARHGVVAGELLHGRPDRRELLVGAASQQQRRGLRLLPALDLVRGLLERNVLEGPAGVAVAGVAAGRLHDPVDGYEGGDDERTHGGSPDLSVRDFTLGSNQPPAASTRPATFSHRPAGGPRPSSATSGSGTHARLDAPPMIPLQPAWGRPPPGVASPNRAETSGPGAMLERCRRFHCSVPKDSYSHPPSATSRWCRLVPPRSTSAGRTRSPRTARWSAVTTPPR